MCAPQLAETRQNETPLNELLGLLPAEVNPDAGSLVDWQWCDLDVLNLPRRASVAAEALTQ